MLDNFKRQQLIMKLIAHYSKVKDAISKELLDLGLSNEIEIRRLTTKIHFLDNIKGFLVKERLVVQPDNGKYIKSVVRTYYQVRDYNSKSLLAKGNWDENLNMEKILSDNVTEEEYIQYLYNFTNKVCEIGEPMNLNIVVEVEKRNDEDILMSLDKFDKYYVYKNNEVGRWVYTETIEHIAGVF